MRGGNFASQPGSVIPENIAPLPSVSFRESSYMHDLDRSARQGFGAKTKIKPQVLVNNSSQHPLFESSQLDQYMTWPASTTRIGPGLANMGNTCFINSVLQCLTYLSPLSGYLLSEDHTKRCPNKNSGVPCILCNVENHVRSCFQTSHAALRPISIVSNLKIIAKHFRNGRQEDAHEFLCFLLEAMQKNFLQGIPAQSVSPQLKETSLIYQVFGGQFQSSVTCPNCRHKSDTLDAFLDICLDIRHVSSLEQAFQAFIAPEKLTRDNSYRCGKCSQMVNAEKRFLIHKCPRVLVIQLKRFTYQPMRFGGEDTKISKVLPFPETLNLDPYTVQGADSKERRNVYSLNGVLVHSGFSCNSGHYYSFVRGPNDIWYSMNDSFVHPVGLTTVLRQPAYLLFYVRHSPGRVTAQDPDYIPVDVMTNSPVMNRLPSKRLAKKIASWVEKPRVALQDFESKDKQSSGYKAIKRKRTSFESRNPFQNIADKTKKHK